MADVDKNIEAVFALFHSHGDHQYLGEKCTQTSHMIQTAMLAEADGQPPEVVLGALLHDIGNLVGHDDPTAEKIVVNDVNIGPKNHDQIGADFLKKHGFPHGVCVFASDHANAIRYKAYKDPNYKDHLSWTSLQTLERRGGPFSQAEAEAFEKLPHYNEIVKCRGWDEKGRDPNAKTEPLEKYKKMAHDLLSKK
jgi:predicted HD phosphohydrolase